MSDSSGQSVTAYPPGYLEDIGAGKHYAQWVFSYFKPWARGRICEVGSGGGTVSEKLVFQPSVKQVVLLEPDQRLFGQLQERVGQSSKVSLFNQTLHEYAARQPEEVFDAFVYSNVLEHIEDDVGELTRIFSMLPVGGAVLIFVPALKFLFSRYDAAIGHCRRYSKTELKEKILQAGFELAELRYFDFFGMFIWFVVCKVLGLRPNAESVRLYDRLLVRISEWLESRWVPRLGKNLLAVAVKRQV